MPARKNLVIKVDDPPMERGMLKRTWIETVKIYLKKYTLSKYLTQ